MPTLYHKSVMRVHPISVNSCKVSIHEILQDYPTRPRGGRNYDKLSDMKIEAHKKIWIVLALKAASGREMLSGILSFISGKHDWEIELDIHPEAVTPARVRELASGSVNGAILTLPCPPAALRALAATKIPVVCVNIQNDALATRTAPTRFVWTDNAAIGNAAAEHLLACSDPASFAFVGLQENDWSSARGRGFAAVLDRARKKAAHFPLTHCPPTAQEAKALRDFLKALPKPAAVFTAYDDISLAVMKAARAAKLKVPGDVAILGTDDTVNIVEPFGLSSIRLDFPQFGHRAATLLHRMLRGQSPSVEPVSIDALTVVRRKSTRIKTKAPSLSDEIKSHLKENATAADCSAQSIAEHFGLSRSTIEHRFREAEGISLYQAIIDARLNAAARRLKASPRRPLAEIAASCGFASADHFSRLYKSRFGAAPRAKNFRGT